MFNLNSINKKLLISQVSILFIILISISIIGFFTVKKYFMTLQKNHIVYLINSINYNIEEKLSTISASFKTITNDKKLEIYNQKFNETILNDFIYTQKDFLPIFSYIDSFGMEQKKMINGILTNELDDFKNNILYKEIINNPNKVIKTGIKYNKILKTFVIEFAYLKQGYFGDEFQGILHTAIPIADLLGKGYKSHKDLSLRLIDNNGNIEYSTNKKDKDKKIKIGDNTKDFIYKILTTNDNELYYIDIMNEESFAMALKLFDNKSITLVSYKYDTFLEIPLKLRESVLTVLFIIFIISIIVTLLFSRKITQPLVDLTYAIKNVSEGKYNTKIEVNTNDEIEILANNFNIMTNQLNIAKLTVEEKTQKLSQVNRELEESEHEVVLMNESLIHQVRKEVEKNRKQDQQLLQQSRLAQMGEMIRMIAHQWRQPLNAISLTSNNLQFKLLMDDVDKELFKKEITLIDEYSQHLSKTIDDFRGFFKEDKTKEITTLQEIVNSTLDIVRISVENKNIKIITDFNCKKKFETYPNEIKQVVLNLIKNAEDILLDNDIQNPTIFIETKCIDNDKILIIRDNGGGIPENIIDKIFDPYFSTKKEKDGTGLGLYMSKTIIEEHCGGKISVSNDNNGAIFLVILPHP